VEWQKEILTAAKRRGFIVDTRYFYPNQRATRGEIFLYAYMIYNARYLGGGVIDAMEYGAQMGVYGAIVGAEGAQM